MVRDFEEHVLEIDGVARDADGENLARSVAGDLLAVCVAGGQSHAGRRHVAFADEVAARIEPPQPVREVENQRAIFIGQPGIKLQLTQQVSKRMILGGRHVPPRDFLGGSTYGLSLSRHGPRLATWRKRFDNMNWSINRPLLLRNLNQT